MTSAIQLMCFFYTSKYVPLKEVFPGFYHLEHSTDLIRTELNNLLVRSSTCAVLAVLLCVA